MRLLRESDDAAYRPSNVGRANVGCCNCMVWWYVVVDGVLTVVDDVVLLFEDGAEFLELLFEAACFAKAFAFFPWPLFLGWAGPLCMYFTLIRFPLPCLYNSSILNRSHQILLTTDLFSCISSQIVAWLTSGFSNLCRT